MPPSLARSRGQKEFKMSVKHIIITNRDNKALVFKSEEMKDNKYVEIVDGKAAFNDSPLGSVWVLDSETGIPMTDCGGTMYYIGCYKTYDTFSASKTSYIADTSLIGVSQFPVVLSTINE